MKIKYTIKTANQKDIYDHLIKCSAMFVPNLHTRINIKLFAEKIFENSITFEAWHRDKLIGLISAYLNNLENRTGFITHVSVLQDYQKHGISSELLLQLENHAKTNNFAHIKLEVYKDNYAAIHIYSKHGYSQTARNKDFFVMKKEIEVTMNNIRDYNQETRDTNDHNYAYSFDFEVMHPYILRSFKPFFNPGNVLELGSYKGDFTKRLLPYFDDITCIEASEAAVIEAKKIMRDRVTIVHSLFENASLHKQYDNIIMTHVLEHLDDPVRVLKRVTDEWLTEGGRFFVACPNANAPSRQIAVKMGLIEHNTAVTNAEYQHGHRITYTLDTLERDVKKAGLKVMYRSGVFFKALANFQWDKLLKTDIISHEYLEGCYELGHQYPDLCSSIFLICTKGTRIN